MSGDPTPGAQTLDEAPTVLVQQLAAISAVWAIYSDERGLASIAAGKAATLIPRLVAEAATLREQLAKVEAEVVRLTRINSDICASHNAVLQDGAVWEARAIAAEAETARMREALTAERIAAEIQVRWNALVGPAQDGGRFILGWRRHELCAQFGAAVAKAVDRAALSQSQNEGDPK